MKPVYIVAATRTPVAKAKGAFAKTRPDDLLAHVLKATLEKVPAIDPARIADVVVGCAMPEGEQGMNVARMASLLAGIPESVSAMTLNRFCASGLQAIATAADKIRLGEADVMLAAGVESMSMVPMGGHCHVPNPAIFPDKTDMALGMGLTAEKVAQEWGIDRSAQDAFALSSHQKAIAAQQSGAFDDEIIPYPVKQTVLEARTQTLQTREHLVTSDEGPREDTSLSALEKLRCVFDAKGSVTAGNTSQMSDGAAAVLLVSESIIAEFDLTPLGRLVSFATAGVSPRHMGIGPVEAVPKALSQAGLTLSQIDWIELNEAFAAQALAVVNTLSMDIEKVNPYGGAIALGHPLGATGCLRTVTLLHGLRRQQKRYGLVTMCIGTGMGAAGIFEAL